MKDRSEDEQSHYNPHQESDERRYDQVDGVRDMLAQPFFKLGGDDTCGKCRENASLISCNADEAEELQRFRHAGSDVIGAGETGAYQHETQDNTDDRASAEVAEGGPAYKSRQEGERGVGQNLGECQQGRRYVVRSHAEYRQDRFLGQKSSQSHEQTGRDQYGDDGNEHVGEHTDRPLEFVPVDYLFLLLRGLADVGSSRDLDGLVIDPVYKSGAENDLVLAGVEEGAFHFVQVFHVLCPDLFFV